MKPSLVTDKKGVIPISDIIRSSLKWKVKNVNEIFIGLNFKDKDEIEIGYDYYQYTGRKEIVNIE